MSFDSKRAWLRGPDYFQRFEGPDQGEPLAPLGLPADTELLVVERGGQSVAYLSRQLSYHHGAQGELGGEPYVISY